jgi:gluconokinase
MIVVLMGVSGSGKTTIGRQLAARLGCEFLDGDDFHPTANVAKMAAGTPLTDEDRWPWLARLNALVRERATRGERVVLACSGLKGSHRARLMQDLTRCELVFLQGSIDLIRSRLATREHRYMPAALLESQFAALEPPQDAIVIDVTAPSAQCVETIEMQLAARSRANRTR